MNKRNMVYSLSCVHVVEKEGTVSHKGVSVMPEPISKLPVCFTLPNSSASPEYVCATVLDY